MRRVARVLLVACVAAVALVLLPAEATAQEPIHVEIDWLTLVRTTSTVPTLQVVVNPLIRPESPIHDQVFASLEALQAEFVRFVYVNCVSAFNGQFRARLLTSSVVR